MILSCRPFRFLSNCPLLLGCTHAKKTEFPLTTANETFWNRPPTSTPPPHHLSGSRSPVPVVLPRGLEASSHSTVWTGHNRVGCLVRPMGEPRPPNVTRA
ncbi:uncharacterized protein BO80DRAFT_292426 [Aspergillus ibericus CBS 121593]|uniref:Uncharacterized protein n=1 Tax=Aspergillus ibericus CBS 121593 TaxID=1448316 RepID=A0A395GIL2_9EURO|nr:hypothetical protein BO80DRAFT_292426 [Aspergillus ibericus CBS 121593]RAK94878.1 hypothetical protein BO80DRAFT_292426 [Aspergillus ibericus CBS 121593]